MAIESDFDWRPRGSLAGIRKAGLNPAAVGSCAPPGGGVKGCPYYDVCPTPDFRDGIDGHPQRPNNVAYLHVAGVGGPVKRDIIPCYGFMEYPAHRRLAVDKNGVPYDVIEICGREGDTVELRGSRRVHPKPEPGCVACSKGECISYVDCTYEVKVPEYQEIGSGGSEAAYGAKARAELAKKLQKEQTAQAARRAVGSFQVIPPEEVEAAGVETSRRRRA